MPGCLPDAGVHPPVSYSRMPTTRSVPSALVGIRYLCYSRGMTIQTGSTYTIKRGKRAGEEATVLDLGEEEAAVRYVDGGYGAVKLTNLNVPAEPTITRGELADILVDNWEGVDNYDESALMTALERALPGIIDLTARRPIQL